MKKCFFILFFLKIIFGHAQLQIDSVLTLQEYLGYVKKYHPIVKQANLTLSKGEAKLLKARGAFDPKIEVDYTKKIFKEKEYYNKLNATFKIPTWYGVTLKTNYEDANGVYLNPEHKTPNKGLYSAGVSVPLAKGLITNNRMATLKQAKLYTKISAAKQQIKRNDILYQAITTYFIWLKHYQEFTVYSTYSKNAKARVNNVIKSYELGDKPAVDTLEAGINFKNRLLDVEKARINLIKSTLNVSNYLWLDNNLPLQLKKQIIPDTTTFFKIDNVLDTSVLNTNEDIVNTHPKLQTLQLKKQQLTLEKRLKTNNLLPKIDVQYNFLTANSTAFNTLNMFNYKGGVNASLPLFLRKERGALKLTKLKLQDVEFDIAVTKLSLKNKIEAMQQQIESYQQQNSIINTLLKDYKKLIKGEERKFYLGEGSLFLINYREIKLIETELKKLKINYELLKSKATLVKYYNGLQ